jgi:hypothetical protein
LVPKVLYWYLKFYTSTQSFILVPKFYIGTQSFILVPKVLYWYPKFYTNSQKFILVPKVLYWYPKFYTNRQKFILIPKVLYWYPKFYTSFLAVGIYFNIFSYDAVQSLSTPRRRADALHVEPRSRVSMTLTQGPTTLDN